MDPIDLPARIVRTSPEAGIVSVKAGATPGLEDASVRPLRRRP
jgi:hypothetical protein